MQNKDSGALSLTVQLEKDVSVNVSYELEPSVIENHGWVRVGSDYSILSVNGKPTGFKYLMPYYKNKIRHAIEMKHSCPIGGIQ